MSPLKKGTDPVGERVSAGEFPGPERVSLLFHQVTTGREAIDGWPATWTGRVSVPRSHSWAVIRLGMSTATACRRRRMDVSMALTRGARFRYGPPLDRLWWRERDRRRRFNPAGRRHNRKHPVDRATSTLANRTATRVGGQFHPRDASCFDTHFYAAYFFDVRCIAQILATYDDLVAPP